MIIRCELAELSSLFLVTISAIAFKIIALQVFLEAIVSVVVLVLFLGLLRYDDAVLAEGHTGNHFAGPQRDLAAHSLLLLAAAVLGQKLSVHVVQQVLEHLHRTALVVVSVSLARKCEVKGNKAK